MLHLHRAERADALVTALGAVVVEPLDDPMAAEVVAVPTRGVERWLTQRLSARLGATPGRADGVCANIDFPYPAALVGGAVAAATGVERDADPWVAARSVWPLLEVIDAALGEPWLEPLARYLGVTGDDAARDPSLCGREARRFGSARHLADLYDRYAVHRPGMLRLWAAKEDVDGAGGALPPQWAWQAELWRRLRERIGVASPAERLDDACVALRGDPAIVDLPARLSLFGLTRLPASFLAVLRALAVHRDVHLFLLHPSPVLWRRVEEETGGRAAVVPRSADPTAALPANPLLTSWGRDAREMQLVLTAGDDGDSEGERLADHHHPIEAAPRESGDAPREGTVTLLQRIQADVRGDRPPPGLPLAGRDDRAVLDPGDTSLAVHACHGRGRQVEVVRDAILHLLAADPALEPRDIVVMCPDIEAFAPLIHATFGAAEGFNGAVETTDPLASVDPGAAPGAAARGPTSVDLRVRLADRALRQTNPVLGVVAELLELASARVTAAQVLDLAGREPIRRRFRFDDDDLARAEEWVAAAGVRWGLDAAHRAGYKLDALDANTWRAGLDRLLLGVAMAEDGQRLVGGVLPLDDVSSSDIDLAGRLAELLDRLTVALDRLTARQPIGAWAAALADAAALLTATTPADAWQTAELRHLLDDVVAEAGVRPPGSDGETDTSTGNAGGVGSGPTVPELTLPEVRALLADRLRGRPTRANFRTGHLTICTLVPMRSVPHRVVCLLGLDDGVFPRKTDVDDDDLVAADARVGDRDPRSEDRQLLLDAVLAAESHLIITYSGRDERTNAERPPAVPVGELLDVVDSTVRLPDDPTGAVRSRTRIVVHHPLQPFDARNFMAGRLTGATPWSFDAVALAGARAAGGERAEPAPFLARPLAPLRGEVVELENLVRFVQHPVKAFLRQRLGVSLSEDADDASDALPVELDALEQWAVGDRLLAGRLAGEDRDACVAAERARGTLPPGTLAEPVLGQVLPIVESLVAEAADITGTDAAARSLEVNVALADGRALLGTVPGVIDRGPAGLLLRSVSYSRLAPKQRLTAWVRFLALTAAHPDRPVEAATIGRFRFSGKKKGAVSIACLAPLAGDAAARRAAALAHLEVLVDLFDRGLCEPLPLYCKTSAAWADTAAPRRMQACSAVWEPQNDLGMGENREPEHQLVLGGVVPLNDLLAAPPGPGESGDGWAGGEPTRFGRYALRLWSGLLAGEEVRDR